MNRILALALAVTALTVIAENSDAQVNGYRFGVGVQQSYFPGHFQREQPPYFAKFPPVYYGEIVPRNYGVSPYAAPAGIMPVEGIGQAETKPTKIVNEFYKKKVDENSAKKSDGKNENGKVKSKKAPWDKSARFISNPYFLEKMAGK